MKEWKVIFATLVIFGTGVVTGGLLVHLTSPKPTPRIRSMSTQGTVLPPLREPRETPKDGHSPVADQRREYLARLSRELQLNPEQTEKIEKVVKDSQQRTKAVWESVQPRMQEEVRKTRDQIRALLDEAQRSRFDEINAPIPMNKEKRFEKGKPPGGVRSQSGAKVPAVTNTPHAPGSVPAQ